MYENVASRALMEHCLDNNALALAGWPTEDVLYSMRHTPQQPSHAVIHRLMKAIDNEQSLETFEDIMSEDPILSYRFMIYTNSAALGLRTGIDSLRRGMVMMGYESIQRWLSDQLPHSSTGAQHAAHPRSRWDARTPDHTAAQPRRGKRLRRGIYLCALLSQMDELLREPWARSCAASRCRNGSTTRRCCTPAPTHPACKWPARWKTTTPA